MEVKMKNKRKIIKFIFLLYLVFFISISFSDFLYNALFRIFNKPDPPKSMSQTTAIDPMPDPPFPLPPPRKPRKPK